MLKLLLTSFSFLRSHWIQLFVLRDCQFWEGPSSRNNDLLWKSNKKTNNVKKVRLRGNFTRYVIFNKQLQFMLKSTGRRNKAQFFRKKTFKEFNLYSQVFRVGEKIEDSIVKFRRLWFGGQWLEVKGKRNGCLCEQFLKTKIDRKCMMFPIKYKTGWEIQLNSSLKQIPDVKSSKSSCRSRNSKH